MDWAYDFPPIETIKKSIKHENVRYVRVQLTRTQLVVLRQAGG